MKLRSAAKLHKDAPVKVPSYKQKWKECPVQGLFKKELELWPTGTFGVAPNLSFHRGDLGDESKPTSIYQSLSSLLSQEQETPLVIPIIGVSGAGKTAACYNIAYDQYVIYFECVEKSSCKPTKE